MVFSIRVISDSGKLLEIEDIWDSFINKYGENPLFLSRFIKQFMEFNRSKGCTPLILVISIYDRVIGIAPLILIEKFGVRFARFLLRDQFSPDFILDDRYRETCIIQVINFLFDTLHCHFVDLTLPYESPNLKILKKICEYKEIHYHITEGPVHYILPIKCTWDEFKASRGKNFRRKIRRYERNLDRAGSWRVLCIEDGEGTNVVEKIFEVERNSWKEKWRAQMGIKMDNDLLIYLRGALYASKVEQFFKWYVWFLELKNQLLSYVLFFQYKEKAFSMKTSYDERYKKFYPGIYINNVAIRELFNKRKVKMIDFLTDLSFHKNWTSLYLPRVRVILSQKRILLTVMKFVYSVFVSKKMKNIMKLLLKRAPFIERFFKKGILRLNV